MPSTNEKCAAAPLLKFTVPLLRAIRIIGFELLTPDLTFVVS
jgi:hypothetical protein